MWGTYTTGQVILVDGGGHCVRARQFWANKQSWRPDLRAEEPFVATGDLRGALSFLGTFPSRQQSATSDVKSDSARGYYRTGWSRTL